MNDATTSPAITEIATVLIPVTDQDRALAFYTERLGFKKRMDYTYGPNRWIEVGPAGSKATVALAPGGETMQPGRDTGIRISTDDAAADHEALKAAGVDVDELLNWGDGVPPMFVLRDPDGNSLVIVQQPRRG
ncbi:MAG TPA: VOC family protein [Candidatus Limnocylindrales bacterium]|nr:VOC family protein [Candidatus Limnocylindrales bacterium]